MLASPRSSEKMAQDDLKNDGKRMNKATMRLFSRESDLLCNFKLNDFTVVADFNIVRIIGQKPEASLSKGATKEVESSALTFQ